MTEATRRLGDAVSTELWKTDHRGCRFSLSLRSKVSQGTADRRNGGEEKAEYAVVEMALSEVCANEHRVECGCNPTYRDAAKTTCLALVWPDDRVKGSIGIFSKSPTAENVLQNLGDLGGKKKVREASLNERGEGECTRLTLNFLFFLIWL